MLSTLRTCVLHLCWAACLFAPAVHAQDDTQQRLDQFLWGPEVELVTATRQADHPYDAPATVITITDDMIRERGYRDLIDVLADIPAFDISRHVYGEFSSLVMHRGIGGNNKLVILMDNHEITSPSGKQFPFGHNVPISLAERIEILLSPASALYGPDAFGVINIITKKADALEGVTMTVIGGQDRTSDLSVHMGKALTDDVAFTVYGRYYGTDGQDLSDDYEELRGIRSYPSIVENRMEAPVKDWNLSSDIRLKDITFRFNHSSFREPLLEGLDPAQYVYNDGAFWGQRITSLEAEHRYATSRLDLVSSAGLRTFEINPEMSWYYLLQDETTGESSTLKVHQYGKTNGVTFDMHANYRQSDRLRLSGGLLFEDVTGMGVGDVYGDPFDTNQPLLINNYGIPQAAVSSQNYGVYGELAWRFAPRWNLIAGTRYDYNTIYGSSANPRFGLIYSRPGTEAVKLLYGAAYIAPSYFHRYETWFLEEYGHIQNPALKPERLHTVELAWIRNWAETLESTVSVYYNSIHELIVGRNYGMFPTEDPFVDSSGDGLVFTEWSDNFGTLYSYGTDIRLNYMASPDFKLDFGYSLLDGSGTDPNTGADVSLFKSSTHKITAGLTYYPFDRISISPRLRWVSDIATRLENARYHGARMPGHFFVNLHARFHHLLPNMDAFVTVTNLLNKRYYTAGVRTESSVFLPRVPQDLRAVMVGFTYAPSM